MTDSKQVADVLNGAADLLERDGWCQKRGRIGPKRDVATAVVDAAVESWRAANQAFPWLREVIGQDGVTIWQDAPGRTQAEVVAALRAAAERAR